MSTLSDWICNVALAIAEILVIGSLAVIAAWLVYVLCVWVGELISDLFFH